ncbi:MAG TPA: LysR substrate-binding domain-containing protein [Alphaproteobacteria bacterium]|nr:LysR substrate-binding domain-containing protein [Alphaproteobacteria bacterium]
MILANLDMDVLRTLAVAMDLGGFAKAGERLGRSQSAVSLQMRKLEERVGRPLFRRQGRGLGLTDAGDVVLGYARRILELNDEALAAARGTAIEGAVRFGVPQDLGDAWLPNVLRHFTRAHPAVMVEARVDRTNKLRERIAQGGLDLALLWGSPPLSHASVVRRLPMAWIGPKGYACARGEEIPLALFDPPCVFRQPGIAALERSHRPWRLAFTSPSLAGLWAAAAAGLGVTVRTRLGLPVPLAVLDKSSGLPKLPEIALSIYAAERNPPPAVVRLREILLDELTSAIAG